MKRHQSIVPLSRDHHTGLLCCWKIRQGLQKQIAVQRIADYIGYFREIHLIPHFQEEEALLFNRDIPGCRKAMDEHAAMNQLVDIIIADPLAEDLVKFADLLESHIRFEERELFPRLEQTMTADELQDVAERIAKAGIHPLQDEYRDHFWTETV